MVREITCQERGVQPRVESKGENHKTIWKMLFIRNVVRTQQNLQWFSQTGGTSGKEPACQSEDIRGTDSIPGSGRSPGEGNGNPRQYFSLENPMDRGTWWATVHRVAKSQSRKESDMTEATEHKIVNTEKQL